MVHSQAMDNKGAPFFNINGRVLSYQQGTRAYGKLYSDYHKYKNSHYSSLGKVFTKGNRVSLEIDLSGKDAHGRVTPIRAMFSIKDRDIKDPSNLKSRIHKSVLSNIHEANKISHGHPHIMDEGKISSLVDQAIQTRKSTIFKHRLYGAAGAASVGGLGVYLYGKIKRNELNERK